MFIYNLKINGTRTFKILLFITIMILMLLISYIVMKLFTGASTNQSTSNLLGNDYTPPNGIYDLSSSNYTNVLKAVHENIDNYVGTKFTFTGYVYKVYDLTSTQFVLARDMIISSNLNYVIVGFLCEYEDTIELNEYDWVSITGEITKGNYHGDMPIVNILSLEKTSVPTDEYVYPPSDSYIPTSR